MTIRRYDHEFSLVDGPTMEEWLDGEYVLYADHHAAMQRERKVREQLVKGLEAMICISDAGPTPRKFDDALSWRDNDIKARMLADEALVVAKEIE